MCAGALDTRYPTGSLYYHRYRRENRYRYSTSTGTGSPRCLFTGTGYCVPAPPGCLFTGTVCIPAFTCVSRGPGSPGDFEPAFTGTGYRYSTGYGADSLLGSLCSYALERLCSSAHERRTRIR